MSLRVPRYGPPQGDAPDCTGPRLLLRAAVRRFPQLFLSGTACLPALIPGVLGFFAFSETVPLFAILAGLLSGALEGPLYGGMCYLIYLSLASEPGYFGVQYRTFLSQMWRRLLLPGAAAGGLLTLMLLAWRQMLAYGGGTLLFFGVVLADMLLLLGAVTAASQLTCARYPDSVGVRTAAAFMGRQPGPVCRAVLWQGIYWFCAVFFFPYSLLILPVSGVWLPALLGAFSLRGAVKAWREKG